MKKKKVTKKKVTKKKVTKKKTKKKKVTNLKATIEIVENKTETENVIVNCDFLILPIRDNWFSHDPFKVVAIEFGPNLSGSHRNIKGFFLFCDDLGLDFYGIEFVDDIIDSFYPYCSVKNAIDYLKERPNPYDRDKKVWKEIVKTLRKNIRLVKK